MARVSQNKENIPVTAGYKNPKPLRIRVLDVVGQFTRAKRR
jgi:hypothetical protein